MIIHLDKVFFYSYHGLFPEEKKTGNRYEVSLAVHFPDHSVITGLDDTINYETLFSIVKDEMSKPRELMETLATEITEVIHHTWAHITRIELTIFKQQPPIAGFSGRAGVSFIKDYGDES